MGFAMCLANLLARKWTLGCLNKCQPHRSFSECCGFTYTQQRLIISVNFLFFQRRNSLRFRVQSARYLQQIHVPRVWFQRHDPLSANITKIHQYVQDRHMFVVVHTPSPPNFAPLFGILTRFNPSEALQIKKHHSFSIKKNLGNDGSTSMVMIVQYRYPLSTAASLQYSTQTSSASRIRCNLRSNYPTCLGLWSSSGRFWGTRYMQYNDFPFFVCQLWCTPARLELRENVRQRFQRKCSSKCVFHLRRLPLANRGQI